MKILIATIAFALLLVAGASAERYCYAPYPDEPDRLRCGDIYEPPEEEPEPTPTTASSGSSGRSTETGTSTRHGWKTLHIIDGVRTSIYVTYQVGVCEEGELYCNYKEYPDRIRKEHGTSYWNYDFDLW